MDDAQTTIDPVDITRTTRGEVSPGQWQGVEPVAQTSGVFSPRDAVLRQQLENYALTRSDGTAYGSDVYLVSMDLFTKFVSHQLIRNLLQDERFRLTRMVASQEGR